MRTIPIPQEIYRHFKGNLYQILTVAQHSETGEEMVVYQALYGDFKTYVRPLAMFMEKTDRIKYPEAGQEYRFERIDKAGMPKKAAERNADAGTERKGETAGIEPERKVDSVGGTTEESGNREGQTDDNGSGQEQPEDGIVNIDPMVIEFLDASSYEERLNILSGLHHRITDDMINIMSIALDIEVKPGDIETRYAEFRSCLILMERFECNRLR